jgi:hypothetical protein
MNSQCLLSTLISTLEAGEDEMNANESISPTDFYHNDQYLDVSYEDMLYKGSMHRKLTNQRIHDETNSDCDGIKSSCVSVHHLNKKRPQIKTSAILESTKPHFDKAIKKPKAFDFETKRLRLAHLLRQFVELKRYNESNNRSKKSSTVAGVPLEIVQCLRD